MSKLFERGITKLWHCGSLRYVEYVGMTHTYGEDEVTLQFECRTCHETFNYRVEEDAFYNKESTASFLRDIAEYE